jgi:16S rRNA (cytidine1402-2'-O)-methyltransferase
VIHGTLYLIPVPLGPGEPGNSLPATVFERVRSLDHFVAENAKSARAFLKACALKKPLQELKIEELSEHTPAERLPALLQPLLTGADIGLLSEAGCPAVADPGAELVALAQRTAIRVVQLVGPSSLLLALMASGLNGQRFAFHGYLPAREDERSRSLRTLEAESRKLRQTQIFIETPYRNRAMFDTLMQACQPTTQLTVATDLTLPGEAIRTLTVGAWKKTTPPEIERRPTVFLLLA